MKYSWNNPDISMVYSWVTIQISLGFIWKTDCTWKSHENLHLYAMKIIWKSHQWIEPMKIKWNL